MSRSIEEKIGYVTGVLQELKGDVKESKEDVLRAVDRLCEQLEDHAAKDDRRFVEIEGELEEVKKIQLKQKYIWVGVTVVVSSLMSGVAFALSSWDKLQKLMN